MKRDMAIALMERDNPDLLKEMNIGDCEVIIKRKNGIGKRVLVVQSDVLYKLEKKYVELAEQGHEVIKSINIKDGKYYIILSFEKNPNSPYLELKKAIEGAKESFKNLGKFVQSLDQEQEGGE